MFSSVNILEETSVNKGTSIKNGYILLSEGTLKGTNIKETKNNQLQDTPLVSVGGVYQRSNISRSYVNLSNIGTLIGTLDLDTNGIEYNYISTLIPGLYPAISGPWTETQEKYNLQSIIDYTKENPNQHFCKILGMGLGELNSYKVSEVSKNGLSTPSFNNSVNKTAQGLASNQQEIILINFSSIVSGMFSPLTTVGESYYQTGFDWLSTYGIQTINGTNTFPFFGWAGSRIGTIKPQNFQFLQDSLYNYPSSLLELAKEYNPIGIVYAGQGVQINSFPIKNGGITFEERNNRTYREFFSHNIDNLRYTGILPYQQGRGIYETFNRQVLYSEINGLVDYIEYQASVPPEGALPGRNNAFMGVTLTDYWSDTLNINKTENNSRTAEDTRFNTSLKQTKCAHNAPLSYISTEENNEQNALPWNSLWSYIGTTTSSSSNQRSSNTPILTKGITTMCISGAYPLYRGTHCSRWSGFNDFINTGGDIVAQYYITKDFWPNEYTNPTIPEITEKPPVIPNPPYRVKGAKIILTRGQRVKAGSYVYSCMNGVSNVTVPQFFPPAAKEIILEEGERDYLLSDIYSKFQANQGSLIVMVSIDGQEPPNPPSCAQPVGVILEDIEGFGEYLYINDDPAQNLEVFTEITPEVDSPIPERTPAKTRYAYDPLKTNSIQAREILVNFFPMYPNMDMTGVPCGKLQFLVLYGSPFSFMTCSDRIERTVPKGLPDYNPVEPKPVMVRLKNSYLINAGDGSYPIISSGFEQTLPLSQYDLKNVQFRNDWASII